jgi:hypothetical protein
MRYGVVQIVLQKITQSSSSNHTAFYTSGPWVLLRV